MFSINTRIFIQLHGSMVLKIELCRNFQITIFFITCQEDNSKIFPLQNQYQARKWGKII